MARNKNPNIPQPVEKVEFPADLNDNLNKVSAMQAEYSEERDLVNQLLGQAQMADAFGKFSQTVWSSKLAFVKENKLYQSLRGKKAPNGLELQGTWVEFCNLLGISDEKANQDIANLTTFGEEALESMSRMGIGYRELRQFRKLPEDQKNALLEVAKAGDKTALLDLAEELIAKHTKEKESLTQKLTATEENLEASRQAVADKSVMMNRLIDEKSELQTKLQRRIKHETPDEEGKLLTIEAAGSRALMLSALKHLEESFSALSSHTERTGIEHAPYMAGLIDDVVFHVEQLRQHFNLPDRGVYDIRPEWIQELDNEQVNDD